MTQKFIYFIVKEKLAIEIFILAEKVTMAAICYSGPI